MVSLARQSSTQGSDLLRQYLVSGSPESFGAIMRAYGGMVYGVCLRVTKDPHDAEDASQAVFLTLAVQCRTGAKINYLGPWLQKVGKRVALDTVRSRKRRNRRETISAQNGPRIEPGSQHVETDNGEVHQLIRVELDALPARYRMPLVMHYFGGLSHEELAKELQCTPNTLGVRLHRGRKMLGERLSARGISLDSITLGLMLAAVVRHAVSDHCVTATTAAAAQVAYGHQLSACFHPGDPSVVHLVQQVAMGGPRARLKMAAITIALGTTALAGGGEAWRRATPREIPRLEELMRRVPFKLPSDDRFLLPRVDASFPSNDPAASPRRDLSAVAAVKPTPEEQIDQPLVAPPIASNWKPPEFALTSGDLGAQVAVNTAPAQWADVPVYRTTTGATLPFWNDVRNAGQVSSASVTRQVIAPPPLPKAEPVRPAPAAPFAPNTARRERAVAAAPPSVVPPAAAPALPPSPVLPSPSHFGHVTASVVPAGGTVFNRGTQQLMVSGSDFMMAASNRAVPVRAGYGLYSWSDSASVTVEPTEQTSTADIEFALYNTKSAGYVTIHTVGRGDESIPAVPTGHTFINFWAIASSVEFSQISISVGYDYALSTRLRLPEDQLKLWVYDGGWRRINDETFSRDLLHHRLAGTVANGELFAVSAPEPTAGFFVTSAIAGLLLRRRRSS